MSFDVTIISHGSIIGFTPGTDAGEAWLAKHLPHDVQCLGTTRFCEPRYAAAIVDGMISDGLTVE